jgi:hypothetical protein
MPLFFLPFTRLLKAPRQERTKDGCGVLLLALIFIRYAFLSMRLTLPPVEILTDGTAKQHFPRKKEKPPRLARCILL